MEKTINLENYRTTGSKVFTGRDRGIAVREKSKIDEIIKNGDSISLVIPADIMSINPSFLEEFLINVVNFLGKDGFYEKITFKSESIRYDIKEDLDEAIERILRTETALSKKK